MPRLINLRGPASSRKADFSARLPTRLPGIAFTARGRAWFRQDLSRYAALPLRTAKAAALAGIYEIAKVKTEKFDPEAAFHAEQATAVPLADWQLHCNLTGETPDTSWTAFTDIVRPLIRIADENDPVTRLARALLTMNDYFRADPDRLHNLADLTAFAAEKVSDDEIARTLATLRQPIPATQAGTNGTVPADL